MDELKEIIGLINQLPALAIWVLLGIFAYKTIIVGSIYGVIRLIADKAYLLLKQDLSKSELNSILSSHENEINRWKRDYSAISLSLAESKAETERVLHMYKILKEANDVK